MLASLMYIYYFYFESDILRFLIHNKGFVGLRKSIFMAINVVSFVHEGATAILNSLKVHITPYCPEQVVAVV